MEDAKDRGDEDLYARLDAAYLTADEDSEVGSLAVPGVDFNQKLNFMVLWKP